MSILSGWMQPYLSQISMALVATVLVVYGSDINRAVKKRVKHLHLVVRILIFVALCVFGYAALLFFGSMLVCWIFRNMSRQILFPMVAVLFFVIGLLAERKNQM